MTMQAYGYSEHFMWSEKWIWICLLDNLIPAEDHPQYDCALLCYAVKEKVIQLSVAPLARDTTVLNTNIIKGKWII